MRRVVITGASSGIGLATAQKFSSEGFYTICLGRNQDRLKKALATLPFPGNAQTLACDLADERAVQECAEQLKNSSVDILVNNAGIFDRQSFVESSDALWMKHFLTNVMGPIRLTRALLPSLKKGGSIVNVASTLGIRPVAMTSVYSSMKAAVINWTQTLALELASQNIRVNCICPGLVNTPIHGELDLAQVAELDRMQPLGRMGSPQDIAESIYFLSRHPWSTGTILSTDGGISLQ